MWVLVALYLPARLISLFHNHVLYLFMETDPVKWLMSAFDSFGEIKIKEYVKLSLNQNKILSNSHSLLGTLPSLDH